MRIIYHENPSYPSGIIDTQWALIELYIPVYPGGRPSTINLRDLVDGILYVLLTGQSA